MGQSQIKWKKGDYITLGKAVSQFNKKINAIKTIENENIIPELLNYSEIKENIKSRNELNRYINNLRKFKNEDASELYETQAGEKITKWEKEILTNETRIAKSRLTRTLNQLKEPTINGYSPAQMGSIEVKQIEAQLKNLNKLENLKGSEFVKFKERLHNIGSSDYTLKKQIQFKENYLKGFRDNCSSFENYDLFLKKMQKLSPANFYKKINESTVLSDFFMWYDNESGTMVYGGFASNEDGFNTGLEEIGII